MTGTSLLFVFYGVSYACFQIVMVSAVGAVKWDARDTAASPSKIFLAKLVRFG